MAFHPIAPSFLLVLSLSLSLFSTAFVVAWPGLAVGGVSASAAAPCLCHDRILLKLCRRPNVCAMIMIISFRHPSILFGHLVLLLLLVQHGHCASQGGEPRPMVCNNDTNFQCVCGTEPPISDAPMLCEYFIQVRSMSCFTSF